MGRLMLSIGVGGMILTLVGRLVRARKNLHLTFAAGSACLLLYSTYLGDIVFTILNGALLLIDIIQVIRYAEKEKTNG